MSSKAPIIIGLICCFLSVSGSIGGAVYWKRCDLELVDCPSPSPSPEAESEPLKDSGEECLLNTDCKSGLSCVRTSSDLKKHCYSIEDCRSKRIENEYDPDDVSCGKAGCMDPAASNYDQNAVYQIPGMCLTIDVCKALDLNKDGKNDTRDILQAVGWYSYPCDDIPDGYDDFKNLCYSSQPDVPASEAILNDDLIDNLTNSYNCSQD